jgi:hypothetical protein
MTAIYLTDPSANGNGTKAYNPRETKDKTYEGWANRQTWNVALWINNDYDLYTDACEFMKVNPDPKNPYKAFIINKGLSGLRTPDKIAYLSTRLNYGELNKMMEEIL